MEKRLINEVEKEVIRRFLTVQERSEVAIANDYTGYTVHGLLSGVSTLNSRNITLLKALLKKALSNSKQDTKRIEKSILNLNK